MTRDLLRFVLHQFNDFYSVFFSIPDRPDLEQPLKTSLTLQYALAQIAYWDRYVDNEWDPVAWVEKKEVTAQIEHAFARCEFQEQFKLIMRRKDQWAPLLPVWWHTMSKPNARNPARPVFEFPTLPTLLHTTGTNGFSKRFHHAGSNFLFPLLQSLGMPYSPTNLAARVFSAGTEQPDPLRTIFVKWYCKQHAGAPSAEADALFDRILEETMLAVPVLPVSARKPGATGWSDGVSGDVIRSIGVLPTWIPEKIKKRGSILKAWKLALSKVDAAPASGPSGPRSKETVEEDEVPRNDPMIGTFVKSLAPPGTFNDLVSVGFPAIGLTSPAESKEILQRASRAFASCLLDGILQSETAQTYETSEERLDWLKGLDLSQIALVSFHFQLVVQGPERLRLDFRIHFCRENSRRTS